MPQHIQKNIDLCDPENLSADSGHIDIMLTNAGFHDVNPILAGQYHCEPGHKYGPNTRYYYLLHYVVSGRGVYRVNGNLYELGQGDIFIIRPDTEIYYEADAENPWHYRWVGFNCNLDVLPEFLKLDMIHAPEADYIFRSMMNADHFSGSKELYISSKIFELFATLSEKFTIKESKSDTYVKLATNYIENNYNDPRLSISLLAKKLHLDRCYLSTIFKNSLGVSPQQFLQECRLHLALKLLGENKYKIEEIAAYCGYNSSFHFSKVFKEKFGYSPSKHRLIAHKEKEQDM